MNLKQTYKKQLKQIDGQYNELVDTLINWANINSGSFNLDGLDRYLRVLKNDFSSLLDSNDKMEVISLPEFEAIDNEGSIIKQKVANGLIIRKRPNIEKRVLLCGHMDTVFPKNHVFQTCKFLDNNILNGPGVADMKGGILVMLTALRALESHEIAKNIGWDVYLSPDEEIGSLSSSSLFSQFASHSFGMIYEPSLPDGEFVGQRKGSGNFSIIVRGKSAHAGRAFYEGRNAIVKLSRIIKDLWELNDPKNSTTLNVGKVIGGQALNVVPDVCIASFNIRVAGKDAADKILTEVDNILAKHQEIGYKIFRHGKISRPAKPMDKEQQKLFNIIKQINNELGLPTKIISTGGCCDGNNLKELGLANIDTLGVCGGNIHSDKEFVLLDSICQRAKLSALILLAFANYDIL